MLKLYIQNNPSRYALIQEVLGMSDQPEEGNRTEEIVSSIHAFSLEAFNLAKLFVSGFDPASLKEQVEQLKERLPAVASQMNGADEAYRPDLNNVLSEARLDLDYVLAGGGRPSSMRLAHVIREQTPGDAQT